MCLVEKTICLDTEDCKVGSLLDRFMYSKSGIINIWNSLGNGWFWPNHVVTIHICH